MATEIKIKNFPTGYQSIITNGTHSIIGDEPVSAKGTDLGLAPSELVLAGIALCKMATIRSVARKRGLVIRDVDAALKQVVKKDKDGKFTTTVNSVIKIEGDITDLERKELLEESDNCYVTRLIKDNWHIQSATTLGVEE